MTTNRIGSAVALRRLAAALALALSAFVVGPAVAQSLGESARKEKERRAKLSGQKSKAYTDKDVGRALAPPSEPQATGQSATSSPGSPGLATPAAKAEEDPTKTEAYWRNRVAEIRKRISDLEGQLSRPGFDQDPTNLSRRQRIEQDVEKARAELVALAEEARRKGVPAGWLR